MFRAPDKTPRSRAIVLLRYTLIIAVAYLLLAEHGFLNLPTSLILLIAAALASNVVITRLPARITDSTAFTASMILADTLWITAALLYSGHFRANFFYVYFFVLLLAAIGENLTLIAVGAVVASGAYVYILSKTTTTLPVWNSPSLIRIPFLFAAAAFYGYLVDRVRREQQRAHAEADTVARLEHEIAERKRAEQDSRVAKEYAENLIKSSLDMIVATDVDRNIVEFNRAAEEAFGYSKAEVVGKPIDILYANPSEGTRVYSARSRYQEYTGTVTNRRKNGEIFHSFLSASVIRDANGTVIGAMGISRDITELKRVESALRESEERYRKVVELSPDAILVHSEGTIDYVNTAGRMLLGAGDPEELIGTPVMDIVHPDYRELVKERIQQRIDEGTVLPLIEEKMIRLDGREVDVEVTAAPISYDDKRGIQAVIRDITERKQAANAVRELTDTLEALVHASPAAIVALDLEGRVRMWNPAAERTFGWSAPEALDRLPPFVPQEKQEEFNTLQRRILQGESLGTVELRRQKKDGSLIDVSLSTAPLRDAKGKITGIMAIITDITERKRREDELRETRQYLTRLIESSADAIMATDKAGNVALFNSGAEALLGYRREEVLGRRVTLVYESEDRAKEVMRRMRQQGGSTAGFETTLRAKDGSLIPVLISASVLFDADGHEAGTVGFSKDLRERKRAEAQLEARARELAIKSERLEILGTLTRTVSATLDPRQVLDFVAEATVSLLNVNLARLWLWEEAAQILRIATSTGDPDLLAYRRQTSRPGQGMSGLAFARRETLTADAPATDARFGDQAWAREKGIQAYAAVPLLFGERAVGVLTAARRAPEPFQVEELALLGSFAAQAAIAIQNAHLYSEALEQTERLQGLIRTGARITGTLQVDEVLTGIAEEAANLLDVEGAGFRLLEGDRLVIRGRYGLAHHVMLNPAIRMGESLTGLVAQQARPIAVPNLQEDHLYLPEHKAAAVAHGVVAYLGVPLRYRERIIGALNVYGKERRTFHQGEVDLLQAFADQAAIALEHAHLFEEAKEKATKLQALNRLSQIVASALDPQQVFDGIVHAAVQLFEDAAANLWLIEKGGETLGLQADLSRHPKARVHRRIPMGQGLVGRIAQEKKPVLVDDVEKDPRFKNVEWRQAENFHAFMGVPLLLGEKCSGSLTVLRRSFKPFDKEEQDLLQAFADHAAIALENARLFEESLRAKDQLTTLLEINTKIGTAQAGEFLQTITDEAVRLLEADGAGFRLVDGDSLVVAATSGVAGDVMLAPRLKIGESLSGLVAAENRPFFLPDTSAASPWAEEHQAAGVRHGVKSIMLIPVRIADRVIGVLNVLTKANRQFTQRDVDLAMAFADQAAISVNKARLYREVTEQKQHLEETIRELKRAEDELKTTQLQLIQSAKFESV
ncbi:MAG: PAS domain S-box protein, partial [Candidatus Methylomirabilales bacterium]